MIRTEACAIRLLQNSYNISILTIHRAPTYIIKKLEAILCSLYTLNTQLFIYGANYLVHNSRKRYWMLYYLHLIHPALFIFLLGFITNQQQQLTVFLLISKFPNYVVSLLYNGLSDHDAQLINLRDIDIKSLKSLEELINTLFFTSAI